MNTTERAHLAGGGIVSPHVVHTWGNGDPEHFVPSEGKGAIALDLKSGEDDPAAVVTRALEALEGRIVGRLDEVEEKAGASEKLTERLDKLEAKLNRPAGVTGDAREPTEERKAFATYLRRGRETPETELKALNVSSDPQGGYLAPEELSTEFIRDLVLFSPIRSVAGIRTTASPSVKYPKRIGATNAVWVGETEARTGTEPSFGQIEIAVKEVATYVDISNQLLADSGGTAEAEVRMALAEDFGQKEGAAFIDGDGVKEPAGLLSDAGIEFTANGHATNLSADALISLMYALPAPYRNRGSWLLSGTTLAILRKMKDGQGNYLWQPSFQVGQPETILGRPVVEAPDMPDVASGAFPVIFGDFATGYRIVDRVALSILVNPYSLATTGQTRIHATRRVGAGVVQPKALRKLKMAAS